MAFKRFGGRKTSFKMHQGNWTCSECGKEITELPFEPTPGRAVYCRDCWSKKRGEKFSR